MHANGYQVATGTITGHILLHDLRQGSKVQHSFIAHRTSVQCLAFHNRILPKVSGILFVYYCYYYRYECFLFYVCIFGPPLEYTAEAIANARRNKGTWSLLTF